MEIDIRDPEYTAKLAVLQTLSRVIDPELGVNIIDMGLVYAIRVNSPAKEIMVEMTLTSAACPMGSMLTGHTRVAAGEALPGFDTTVTLVWEPKWNADRISEAGKQLLGW